MRTGPHFPLTTYRLTCYCRFSLVQAEHPLLLKTRQNPVAAIAIDFAISTPSPFVYLSAFAFLLRPELQERSAPPHLYFQETLQGDKWRFLGFVFWLWLLLLSPLLFLLFRLNPWLLLLLLLLLATGHQSTKGLHVC